MSSELRVLIGKLNPICKRALETAAALCVAQTHYNVEVEHLLLKLLDLPATDAGPVFRYFDIQVNDLTKQLTQAIDKFDRGNSRTPAMSPHVLLLLREAWSLSTLHLDSDAIRSGALLLALYENETLRTVIHDSCPLLAKIPRESLRDSLRDLIRESAEETAGPSAPGQGEYTAQAREAKDVPTTALDKYTLDLTAEARAGKIDPIRGRDGGIRQVIDILTRRRQNNPILVGEAGVGKTAVAEGFALRVASGQVPEPLRNISLRVLDLGLLQAGAGVKGEFEERLKSVIAEVKAATKPVILFIDEAHTLIGAGGAAGQGDAANLLKPALARGELRTIAATTWSEYKKYFEKDPALTRRFQVVKVEEPTEETCEVMMRGFVPFLEKHHNLRILDEAVSSAVRLSHRYLAGRQLPDKAVSILDTACARLSLGQNATPAPIEDAIRELDCLEVKERVLTREAVVGADHAARLQPRQARTGEVKSRLEALQGRFGRERELVTSIRDLRSALETGAKAQPVASGDGTAAQPALDPQAQRQELAKLEVE